MTVRSRRLLSLWLAALAAVAALSGACSGDAELDVAPVDVPTESVTTVSPVYLALGDSLAIGVGASDWPTGGYVPRLHARMNATRTSEPPFELINVGRSGADTRSVIEEGQLAEALTVIEARRDTPSPADDVQVITVGIGGNDGFSLVAVCNGVIDEACLAAAQERIREVRKNLRFIVDSLQEAAGPAARIAVMTYYNPLVHESCPLHEFKLIGDAVLEGQPALGVIDGLNDVIRAAAADAGVPIAEVGEFGAIELTGDCLHASDAGHVKIAAAFEAALNS